MGAVIEFRSRVAGEAERIAQAVVGFLGDRFPGAEEAVVLTALAAAFVQGAKLIGLPRATALEVIRELWRGD